MPAKTINVALPPGEHRTLRRIAREKKWSLRTTAQEAVRVLDEQVKSEHETPRHKTASDNGNEQS